MTISFTVIVLETAALIVAVLYYQKVRRDFARHGEREKETSRRMYELSILKELGDRVGYSLNISQITDIITGSLHQFIDYSVVSSMMLGAENIVFKAHLERSVSRAFIADVRQRMVNSLSALLDKDLAGSPIEEVLSGAILVDELTEPIRSYFNIPLVIGGRVVGILTIASTAAGLYQEAEMNILYKITAQASQAVTRLEEVIKIEQRKINSMVESISEGVVMTDKDYRVVVANPASKKIARIEHLPEPTIFDFIDNLQGKFDIRGRLEESVKLDKAIEIPEVLLGDRFFEIFVNPVKSSTGMKPGELLGGVVIFHDITKEKEVERLRDDFTSMLVHELRSPLDGIRKMTDLIIRKKAEMDPKKFADEYAPIIFNSASGMLQMVNELLDVAKLEAGKFEIFKKPSNIKAIAEECVKLYSPSADEKHIVLKISVDPQIPEAIDLDPSAISQIFDNFISNGLKFAKSEIRISIIKHSAGTKITEEAARAGAAWLISETHIPVSHPPCVVVGVSNDGPFLSSDQMAQLFNKFKQFRASAMERKGTGLGLAIAKGLAEAHTGAVGVASEEGRGVTFYFTLPTAN